MNRDSLILGAAGVAKPDQSIGEAGGMGFGVGVYGGDDADLEAMGLSPMDGCYDITSDNYGNYIHTNGSIMVFIPAFCYRIGNAAAPSYSRDGANALEIGSPELDGTDGWILHRAFIDGGQQKLGFFMDKYLCSKSASNPNIAVSVKNADQISLIPDSSYINSSSMTGCSGRIYDAITLSRARGEQYACVSAFQWSAIAMLSLAHGQAVTSSETCAWYDSGYTKNFPKGSNTASRTDVDDSSVTYSAHTSNSFFGKTGSGTPFAKTTHNGQGCGICDINGVMWQPLIGFVQSETAGTYMVAKESVKMHDFTNSNYNSSSLFDSISGQFTQGSSSSKRKYCFGNGANCSFHTASSGSKRALCGVIPSVSGGSSSGTSLFGKDYGYWRNNVSSVVTASGNCNSGSNAGVWCRYGDYSGWHVGVYSDVSFRAAGYAS